MTDIDLVVSFKDEFESLKFLMSSREFQDQQSMNVLLIDNGSTDPRIDKWLSEIEALPHVKVFRIDKNLGFGGGIKYGLRRSSAKWVGWYPLNLKVDFKDVISFADLASQSGADLFKARRVNRPFLDSWKTLISGLVISGISGRNLLDSGGTPTFIDSRKLQKLYTLPDDYAFELAVLNLARKCKWEVQRCPVPYKKRKFGNSHWQKGFYSETRLFWRQVSYIMRGQN